MRGNELLFETSKKNPLIALCKLLVRKAVEHGIERRTQKTQGGKFQSSPARSSTLRRVYSRRQKPKTGSQNREKGPDQKQEWQPNFSLLHTNNVLVPGGHPEQGSWSPPLECHRVHTRPHRCCPSSEKGYTVALKIHTVQCSTVTVFGRWTFSAKLNSRPKICQSAAFPSAYKDNFMPFLLILCFENPQQPSRMAWSLPVKGDCWYISTRVLSKISHTNWLTTGRAHRPN